MLTDNDIKIRIAHKHISNSYDLKLPKNYTHDVAHDCISIMDMPTADTPFTIMYRDAGTQFDRTPESLKTSLQVFGNHWPIYRFWFDYYNQLAKCELLTPEQAEGYLRGTLCTVENGSLKSTV